jgi:hypothetical protein
MSIVELFCDVDDFCQTWVCYGLARQLGQPKRGPKPSLVLSEIMTIMIHFHQSHYRDFKAGSQ